MEMTVKTVADALDGAEYGKEGSAALFAEMKAANLVAVFGQSDDIMFMNGAIHDEFYDTTFIDTNGAVTNQCECDDCPNFTTDGGMRIEPIFCAEVTFDFKTLIPHAKFTVVEGADIYGYGFVFSLDNLKP